MTNNENINELETLRSQLNILKKKLDDQTIVNDQLLRNAMSNKMSWNSWLCYRCALCRLWD